MANGKADKVLKHPTSRGVRRVVVLAILALSVFLIAAFIDGLIYLRQMSWATSTLKGMGAVYGACRENLPNLPASGIQLIDHCHPDVPADFEEMAKGVAVFPGGCKDKSVIAWGPELHCRKKFGVALPLRSGRAVFFDDMRTRFVSLAAFEELGCP